MKSPSEFAGIFIHKDPVDMRKGINGLCAVVEQAQMGELTGNYLFVFAGKRKKSIKVLYFDKSGFALWQKRLEAAKFCWPKKDVQNVVKLTSEQFSWLLEGYDVWKMKPFAALQYERFY